MNRPSLAILLTLLLLCQNAWTADGLSLNLVTFNIRMPSKSDGPNEWKYRRGLVVETIKGMEPDVMGVQEAFAFQMKELDKSLPNHAYVGVGRDDGKADGEFAGIFYRSDRFELIESDTFWLSDTPFTVASNTWDAACTRICTWLQLREKTSKRTFSVYNAHYDHISKVARENSSKAIVMQMIANEHDGKPLILMGDFNTGPSSAPMRTLFNGEEMLLFQNTLKQDGEEQATYGGWSGRIKGRQIDYILIASDPHTVVESGINRHHQGGRYPSDHYPVFARVNFP